MSTGRVVIVSDHDAVASAYVGVGVPQGDTVLRIVDPQSRECQGQGRVGEIWLDGTCKGAGYYQDPTKTAEAFHGIIKGEEGGRVYLQTGDQGFMYDGHLYITGRIKDLIIIRGKNIYPQDAEYMVEQTLFDLIKPGCSAFFGVHLESGEESVACVAELQESKKLGSCQYPDITERIRKVVADNFQVSLSAVVLIKARTIPKTTSGKIQRHKCKQGFHDGFLQEIHRWVISSIPVDDQADEDVRQSFQNGHVLEETAAASDSGDSFQSVAMGEGAWAECEWPDSEGEDVGDDMYIQRLIDYVAESRGLQRGVIAIDDPLSLMGFDSMAYIALSRAMSQWVGKEVSPMAAYRYQTIRELSQYLARGVEDDEGLGRHAMIQESHEVDLESPVAVVGIGLKAPGGERIGNITSPSALWDFFLSGADAVRDDMPEGRRAAGSSAKPIPGAYLDDIDQFDASFFGISRAEAQHIDYKQAQVLETVWHALEDTGMDLLGLAGRSVGVYVGAVGQEFALLCAKGSSGSKAESVSPYTVTGVSNSLIANRLSHFLSVRGPSMVVDTACSSSLVAVHNAVTDLRIGKCSMAIAGGVNLVLTSKSSEVLQAAGLLSDSCKAFDASADGYCRGEACGVVILKRLSMVSPTDRVYAVIRGSAASHGGKGNGLGVPDTMAYKSVIRSALEDARVKPKEMLYVEAMGAGGKLGELAELSALSHVLGEGRSEDDAPCLVASCKANIGHTEAAGCVMSLIRACLIMYHGVVPKALHFTRSADDSPIDRGILQVPRDNTLLPSPAFAGVSAFGIGGLNAHMVLQKPSHASRDMTRALEDTLSLSQDEEVMPLLLPISARSDASLRSLVHAYRGLLSDTDHGDHTAFSKAKALALGAARHRAHLVPYRIAGVGRSPSELAASLDANLDRCCASASVMFNTSLQVRSPEVAFYFPEPADLASSSAIISWGGSLYQNNKIFRSFVEDCNRVFTPQLNGLSVVELLFVSSHLVPCPSHARAAAVFAVQYALTKLWMVLGVKPDVMEGIGVGAVVASVVNGRRRLDEVVSVLMGMDEGSVHDEENTPEASPEWEDDMLSGSPPKSSCSSPASTTTTGEYRQSSYVGTATDSSPSPSDQDGLEKLEGDHFTSQQTYLGRRLVVISMGTEGELSKYPQASAIVACITEVRNGHDAALGFAQALAEAYEAGVALDFSPLSPLEIDQVAHVNDLNLPLYPFQSDVYAPMADLLRAAVETGTSASKGRDYGVTTFFEETWLPRAPGNKPRRPLPERIVYVCSSAKDAAILMTCAPFSRASHRVVVIHPDIEGNTRALMQLGSRTKLHERPELVVADFTKAEECAELYAALHGNEPDVNVGALYISTTGGCSLDDMDGLAFQTFRDVSHLIGLLRCLTHRPSGNQKPTKARLWVITTGAKAVLPGDRVSSLGAALWSLTKSVPQELYPTSLWVTLVDLKGSAAPLTPENVKAFFSLMEEEMRLCSRRSVPEQLALRGGKWFVMRLQPSAELENDLTHRHVGPSAMLAVQQEADDGWFLVTGGLGGLGLHAAHELVNHGTRRLILVSRRGTVPDRYLDTLRVLERVSRVEVRVMACDVGNRDAVFRLFEEVPGRIRGIIHCAGALSDGHLMVQDAAKLAVAWHGKINGAINLHLASLRQVRPLDSFFIYASSSSLFGSPGESTYAAANAAVDSLAIIRRQQGLACTSLQWGTWIGIDFASKAFNEELAKSGFPALTEAHATKVVGVILNRQGSTSTLPPVLACVPVKWSTFQINGPELLKAGDFSCCEAIRDNANASTLTPIPRTEDVIRYIELAESPLQKAMLEDTLVETIRDVTGMTLERFDSLQDAGITSVQAMEMINILEQRLGIRVQPTKLVEYRCIFELAPFLAQQLEKAIKAPPKAIPLSNGQKALIDSGCRDTFIYYEQTVPGGIAESILCSALATLVGLHDMMRIVLDSSGTSQRILDEADVAVEQLFLHMPDTGRVRDLHWLDKEASRAGGDMETVPPVRLVVSQDVMIFMVSVVSKARRLRTSHCIDIFAQRTQSCT